MTGLLCLVDVVELDVLRILLQAKKGFPSGPAILMEVSAVSDRVGCD